LKQGFDSILAQDPLLSEKDRSGHTLASWMHDPNSDLFCFKKE
jgi:hypothetical protein